MGIEVASSFTMKSALPLDDRFVVADTTARDAIEAGVRHEGLLVYVVADQTMYQLQGGIENTDWVEAGGSGGGVLVVADATARDAIEDTDRYDGLLVYVLDGTSFFQLRGGITNDDWVLLDLGLICTDVQTLSDGDTIVLKQVMRERVKIKSTGGNATVKLPDGTIDGQMVTIQGDDDDDAPSIANGDNVYQNGDSIPFTKFMNVTYCWDADNATWVQMGGM